MLDRLTNNLDFQGQALALRAERQKVLAGNIANADTPGFKARDFDFARALQDAISSASVNGGATGALTNARHIPVASAGGTRGSAHLAFRLPEQASIDGNTVDMDRERANFADNSVRYEATLRFINGQVRTALSAIRGD
jgi:flagellar basal-body rod protein FlgB